MRSESEKHEKKFQVKFMVHIAMFLAVLGISVVLSETNDLSTLSLIFLAITPVVPIIFLLRLIVNYYRTLDEYIQRLMGESLIWAVGVIGCFALGYGLISEMVELPKFSPAFMLPAVGFVSGIVQFFLLKANDNEE